MSQPDDHAHEPFTLYPPSTTSPAPIGAYDEEMRTEVSRPHTSSCACCGNSARCQLWTPTMPATHPVDPQAPPIRRTAS